MSAREPNLDPRCPHGTRAGYQRWRCGCADCREWNALNQRRTRERRRRARAAGRPVLTPGERAAVGDEVRHPVLGWGRVLEATEADLTVRLTRGSSRVPRTRVVPRCVITELRPRQTDPSPRYRRANHLTQPRAASGRFTA